MTADKKLTIAYFTVLAAELVLVLTNQHQARLFTKPLLMPLLMLLLVFGNRPLKWSATVAAALFFSWLGDIFLQFDNAGEIYFLLGLGSFLLAHIFYIIFLARACRRQKVTLNWLVIAIVAAYFSTLVRLLAPTLHDLFIPVIIYGVVLCTMAAFAMHLYWQQTTYSRLLIGGALLFVVSDSLLAVNKFHAMLPFAGFLIMLTYGLAQFFIVRGAIYYLGEQPYLSGNKSAR